MLCAAFVLYKGRKSVNFSKYSGSSGNANIARQDSSMMCLVYNKRQNIYHAILDDFVLHRFLVVLYLLAAFEIGYRVIVLLETDWQTCHVNIN